MFTENPNTQFVYLSVRSKLKKMYVIKRDGRHEPVHFEKIAQRYEILCKERHLTNIDVPRLAQTVIQGVFSGVTTQQLDILAAETAASRTLTHPEYSQLAAAIEVSNLHKKTCDSFSQAIHDLGHYVHPITKKPGPLVSKEVMEFVAQNTKTLDEAVDCNRDYMFDYQGFKTLERAYLLKMNNKIVERPQYMWMRVALGIWGSNLENVIKTYDALSNGYYIHATPTLFNGGTPRPQMSSCFLLTMADDSISGIYKTLNDCATISKYAGGIGVSIHKIRSEKSYIAGTNGTSNGIVPMLQVYNGTARYVDQCFTSNTHVLTPQNFKSIDSIVAGDEVYNGYGQIDTVESVFSSMYSGEMCCFESPIFVSEIQVTPEHLLFILPKSANIDFETLKTQIDHSVIGATYTDAKDVTTNDMAVFPIPRYVQDVASWTCQDVRFMGMMRAFGHISSKDNSQSICLNPKMEEPIQFVKKYLASQIIPFKEVKVEKELIKVSWNAPPQFCITRSLIFAGVLNNEIHSNLLHLPLDKVRSFLYGFLYGNPEVKIDCDILILGELSFHMKRTIRYMLFRLGMLCEYLPYTLVVFPNQDLLGLLDLKCTEQHNMYFTHDDLIYAKIELVSRVDVENTKVYDLRMSNQTIPSYVTNMGIVHNGGGKRKGSFAMYLEPWHADIEAFIDLKKNHGKEEVRARDLFYAFWIPDLFMKRVESNGDWSLFCPNEAPGLADVHSEEFEKLYEKYEQTPGLARKVMKAQALWSLMKSVKRETGVPYFMSKDNCNRLSNQQNLGTIRSSNLCCEIVQYTSPEETAVCNLASLNLVKFVNLPERQYDFATLMKYTQQVVRNLNQVIDRNYYPVKEAKYSNMKHRPMGIGVQGLTNVFQIMGLPYESPEACELNRQIFEAMYYAAMCESMNEARRVGRPYDSYKGSPISKGQFQFDLHGVSPSSGEFNKYCPKFDWNKLRAAILQHGIRNSLLMAPMPTASTSRILGNTECFEVAESNAFTARTLAGDFTVVNPYMVRELSNLGMWNDKTQTHLQVHNGSIQGLTEIPQSIRDLYKTVWEVSQKKVMDQAIVRAPFICQSQSLNISIASPTQHQIDALSFYAWKNKLKTWCYYLRTRPRVDPIKITADKSLLEKSVGSRQAPPHQQPKMEPEPVEDMDC